MSVSSDPVAANRLKWLPLALIGLMAFGLWWLGLGDWISLPVLEREGGRLKNWVAVYPVLAPLVYVAAYVLGTGLGLPVGLVLTVAGGYLFGPFLGLVLAAIGGTTGAVVIFLAARSALHDVLARRIQGPIAQMRDGFQNNAFNYLLSLRLIPIFPFWLVNIVAGIIGVRLRTYIAATAIGVIPGGFVYASLGETLERIIGSGQIPGLSILTDPWVVVALTGLAILSLLPILFRKWAGARRAGANNVHR